MHVHHPKSSEFPDDLVLFGAFVIVHDDLLDPSHPFKVRMIEEVIIPLQLLDEGKIELCVKNLSHDWREKRRRKVKQKINTRKQAGGKGKGKKG